VCIVKDEGEGMQTLTQRFADGYLCVVCVLYKELETMVEENLVYQLVDYNQSDPPGAVMT